ncbi:hypothetical protein, partial [Rhizobium sp. RSm-3]|uniref:hypothetical protein n=1 Tax=Rhizobium sp. RSm-3 TaxID=1720346 RepID=UPI001AED0081
RPIEQASIAHSIKSDLRQKRNPDSTKSQTALKNQSLRKTGFLGSRFAVCRLPAGQYEPILDRILAVR